INLITNVSATPYGMNYWIGTWVDGGGGSQLWSYDTNTASWTGTGALTAYSFTPGVQSIISCTVARSALNLVGGDVVAFDAYSTGGGGADSAVDALANPNVSITSWGGPYTSQAPYLDTYVVPIPEPATLGLLGVGVLVGLRLTRRTR
ncbi:MAG: PEP-CTERM sorting domain-containing protein, partial [bacterium]|nr:PEP-CTERM sorting domain-containing protein [bacterium]